MFNVTGLAIEPPTSRTDSDVLNNVVNRRFEKKIIKMLFSKNRILKRSQQSVSSVVLRTDNPGCTPSKVAETFILVEKLNVVWFYGAL